MSVLRFFDIAANLSDKSYKGIYNKKYYHPEDISTVISRAQSYGVEKFLLAGGNLKESNRVFKISSRFECCFCTIGVHPCFASVILKQTIDSDDYFSKLSDLIETAGAKCVAIGECGLDYDRLSYSDKESQLKAFQPHFDLAESTGLPMYFHNRNTGDDFISIVRNNRGKFSTGVVHSFTGTIEELHDLLSLGLFIGVNGCSLKTEANIQVVREIPLEKMMIETDAPYCEIRKTSPAYKHIRNFFPFKTRVNYSPEYLVKDRNEPCTIVQVLQAVAAIKGIEEERLAEITFNNACQMFKV